MIWSCRFTSERADDYRTHLRERLVEWLLDFDSSICCKDLWSNSLAREPRLMNGEPVNRPGGRAHPLSEIAQLLHGAPVRTHQKDMGNGLGKSKRLHCCKLKNK